MGEVAITHLLYNVFLPLQGHFWLVSVLGSIGFMVALLFFVFFIKRKLFLPWAKSFLLVWVTVGILKVFINRPRPLGGDFSFPSGHSSNVFTLAMLLYVYNKKYWPIFILAGIVAFSRLALGLHHITDVLFGGFYGMTLVILLHKNPDIFKFDFKKKIRIPKNIVLILIVLVSLSYSLSYSYANEGSMLVPAVVIYENATEGVMSEINLKVVPGSGRVFVSASPLSHVDAQASARIANKVACEKVEANCNRFDFLYSLSSEYGVIGGPSAGAAMTVLTMSVLNRDEINKTITITGTINLDGSVGVVGGLASKAVSARESGFVKMLSPKVESHINVSGIEVVGVSDINEAYNIFIGKEVEEVFYEIDYTFFDGLMRKTAEGLVGEYEERLNVLESLGANITDIRKHFNETSLLFNSGYYYSASSYSVQGIIDTQEMLNDVFNNSFERVEIYEEILSQYERVLKEKIVLDSATDIEILLITKDRMYNARKILSEENYLELAPFFEARVTTVMYWYDSLGYFKEGRKMIFDESTLKELASLKLFEARESIYYSKAILGEEIGELDDMLMEAYNLLVEEEYMVSIYRSIETKTLANMYLELQGVKDTTYFFTHKSNEAERYISLAQERGVVPILAISYYEYAQTLQDESHISSLLYISYAKEFAMLSFEISELQKEIFFETETYAWLILAAILCLFIISAYKTKD